MVVIIVLFKNVLITLLLCMFCITIQKQLTPLYVAAQENNCLVIEILFKYGADVNAVGEVGCLMYLSPYIIILFCQGQWTPLLIAAQKDNSSVIESLIKHGAEVNSVTEVSYCSYTGYGKHHVMTICQQQCHPQIVNINELHNQLTVLSQHY